MGKAKQVDLHNKPVSPVTVKKTPVSYVKEDYESVINGETDEAVKDFIEKLQE